MVTPRVVAIAATVGVVAAVSVGMGVVHASARGTTHTSHAAVVTSVCERREREVNRILREDASAKPRTTPYVVREVVARRTLSWSDADATLVPLSHAGAEQAGGRTSFTDAERALGTGLTSWLRNSIVSSAPTAARYAYTNRSYGKIQPNGSVKLSYTRTPVWLFTIPLAHADLSASQGGPCSDPPSTKNYAGCTWYYIVDARNAEFLTSGEHCERHP